MEAAGIAAGIVAVEQAVATSLEGAAAYALAKPTLPLKAHFRRLATSPEGSEAASLRRCNHSLTVLSGKAYIFGGEQGSKGNLCSNEIHIISLPQFKHSPGPEYQCIPALLEKEGGSTPAPRRSHKTKVNGDKLEIYGGFGEAGSPVDESERYSFNTDTLRWSLNRTSTADPVKSVSSPQDAIEVGGYLYFVDQGDDFSTTIQYRKSDNEVWESHTIPKNPLAPGPAVRKGGTAIAISTGYGRNYLIFLFDAEHPDIWALQLHSDQSSLSKAKDAIRGKADWESGLFEWAQVEVLAPEVETGSQGKSLPGPMAHYAADRVVKDEILLWGGVDARGEVSGDGWLVKFE